MKRRSSSAFADSKPHYKILNGLRGVAALMVIWYHVFEAFATSPFDQRFNHGYLAVDFFFVLSGFVIGYAYDDRWGKMSKKDFFKRRLIRLHPMIIMGTVLGVITFLIQGSVQWNGTKVSLSFVMLAMLLHLFLLPAIPGTGADVRGNNEMFPLNGPTWSLFFEYIGNILYALWLRKLSTKALRVVVILSGAGLASFSLFNLSGFGHLGVGWTLLDKNFLGGMLRLLFAFSIGLLMSRDFKPVKIRGAFLICSLTIIGLLSAPYIGGPDSLWMNGLYDAVCTIAIFPALVYLGASGKTSSKAPEQLCRFLGDISYPLYMVHYPLMYLFYAWIWKNGFTFGQTWMVAVGLFVGNIVLAYLLLKVYDEPVRRLLAKRFLHKNG
ncbi:MAG: acyltransferase [Bacteroidota bacterium]|jgi:peptidoglycan/LPS O-acetylase OafA/YrhL|nr:acyltransferase [Bacteroidota bacterium]HHU97319.1 acyltransferase [Petrimonas sp.]